MLLYSAIITIVKNF